MKLSALFLSAMMFSTLSFASTEPVPKKVQSFAASLEKQSGQHVKVEKLEGSSMYKLTAGFQVAYITSDSRYVFGGAAFDTEKSINVTQHTKVDELDNWIKANPSSIVTFHSKNQKHQIWVFSSPECHYCQKFHKELPELEKNGVTVHYFPLSLSGRNTPTYDSLTGILCSHDPAKELDQAYKLGKQLPANEKCKDDLDKSMELSVQFNVTGTPTIILDNGMVFGEVLTVNQVLGLLNKK